jgi:hypothetical protein
MLNWINANEPLWLFIILAAELVVGLATLTILLIEYHYDKEWNETKSKRKKTTKNKVKVIIDKEGNARIAETPKDIDISIEHEGEQK